MMIVVVNGVECYSDFIISEYDKVYAISLCGFDSAVKSVRAYLMSSRGYKYLDAYNDFAGGCHLWTIEPFSGYTEKMGNFVHSVMISESFKNGEVFLYKKDFRNDYLYGYLYKNFTIPIKKEWMDYISGEIINLCLIDELKVYDERKEYGAWRIKFSENDIKDIIKSGLQNGCIKICEKPGNFKVATLDEFMNVYGKSIAQDVLSKVKPLYSPGDEENSLIHSLTKKPLNAQKGVIMGIAKALNIRKNAIIVGEMGTGKTLMGTAIPYIHSKGKSYKCLVMCPGHIVQKWKREIEETVPGARAVIVRSVGDILKLRESDIKEKYLYLIISRDKAKLGYYERPAVRLYKIKSAYICPDCGYELKDKQGLPVQFDKKRMSNLKCPNCGAILWEADNRRLRRYSVAEYIKRHMKGHFDYFIADEVHELKGGDTAQGNTFGILASACRHTIALTGTLIGGYSSNLFYILQRLCPETLKKDGIYYKDITKWISLYGVLERTYKEERDADYNVMSRGKKRLVGTVEKPGVSPVVFSRYLMGLCAFVELNDIESDLPPYKEIIAPIIMDDELYIKYKEIEAKLKVIINSELVQGNKSHLSTYLNLLLSYPDRPYDNGAVTDKITGHILLMPDELPQDRTYMKERKLIEYILNEKEKGRKVFVYVKYTGIKDITQRLRMLLDSKNIKSEIINSNIKPELREEWIRQKVEDGADVIIGNAELVKTGLDLLDFPSIVFYQTGYNIYTLRQASRRSWRIGQKKPVEVVFMEYMNSMQETALQLVGTKLEASMSLEGKFSEEGLRSLSAGTDMATMLAKVLVGSLKMPESAEEIWKRMYNTEDKIVPEISTEAVLNKVKPDVPWVVVTEKNKKNKKIASGQIGFDLAKLLQGC